MDLKAARDEFVAAKTASGDVRFGPLTKGFDEIANLYDSMGQVFHFAAKDVRKRIKIMRLLEKENDTAYASVNSALDYEKAEGIMKKTKAGKSSATKILMLMHWEVSFLIIVIERMSEGQDDTKMSKLCRKAYDEVLAAYESLPIRTASRLGIKTLPVRKDFVKKYIKQDSAEALSLVPAVVAAMKSINGIMEAAFIKHDLMKEAQAEAEKNKAEDAAQPHIDA